MRELALKTLVEYIKARSIVEKRIYRERLITFYSQWLIKSNTPNRHEHITRLKKLLTALRK